MDNRSGPGSPALDRPTREDMVEAIRFEANLYAYTLRLQGHDIPILATSETPSGRGARLTHWNRLKAAADVLAALPDSRPLRDVT